MSKILIISHHAISTYHNMGKTFLAMFDCFSPSELCQLYIYPSVPDIDKCSSYYQITDRDILKSYFKLKVNGREVIPDLAWHQLYANPRDEQIYRNPKNKRPLRVLARDLMWKCARWYNRELRSWLDRERPDVVFVAPGPAVFLYNIALRIAKERHIPIVTYICDDYYFVEKRDTRLGRLHQTILARKIETLMAKTAHVVTICDELKDLYSKRFKTSATTVMTGSNYPLAKGIHVCKEPHVITYMGNIRCNRYVSLAEIGRALDEINSEQGTNYALHIYSPEKDKDILSSFAGIHSVQLRGFVSGDSFDRVFHSAEILLHTEAFDAKSIDFVKHSVSTKIADSLASGIPMLAYGPKQVASMKHLTKYNCAIMAYTKEELKATLRALFSNDELRMTVAKNGLAVANEYHTSAANSKKLYQIMENV